MDKKEDADNYRPLIFSSLSGKVMKQIFLEATPKHKNN